MKKSLLFLAFFSILFSACKKSDSPSTVDPAVQAATDDAAIKAYLTANNITATKDVSGLYYQIITTGTGATASVTSTTSSTIRVAYTGILLNGTQFDTNANFTTLLSAVIKGWQIGIPFIKPDGRIKLFIPSALGYGTTTTGSIPANSVLIFTIDLFAVQG